MDDDAWNNALAKLDDAADSFAVLSRCVAVRPQLETWRRTRDDLSGADAANALDQARGDLERLASGGAATLTRMLQSILDELPTPLE